MEEVDFELLKINISKENLPGTIHAMNAAANKYSWKLAWGFQFEQYRKGYDLVRVFIDFSLVNDDNENEAPLVYVEIENLFKVTAGLKIKDKAFVLDVFFHTTIGNMQGFLAAKFEGTSMAGTVPPDPYDEYYIQEFLTIAQDEWKI